MTDETHNPCRDCLLKCDPVENHGNKNARFLVVGKPITYHQSQETTHNLTRGALKLFSKYMELNGFTRDDFIFTNAVKCAFDPESYINADRKVIKSACKQHLDRLIREVGPEVILPLGADATNAVFGKPVKVTKVRGILNTTDSGHQVLPLLDPAFVKLYPQHEAVFASDCKSLRRMVDFDYDVEAAESSAYGDYEIVDDLQFLIDENPEYLAFDTETMGLRWADRKSKILTMQFCPEPGRAYMLVWDHPDNPVPIRKKNKLRGQLRQLLQNPDISIVTQNGKYDCLWTLEKLDIRFRIDHDTNMLAAQVDENLQNKDLDTLTKIYAPEMAGYADSFNAKWDKEHMEDIPIKDLMVYGCGDVDATMRVFYTLSDMLYKDKKAWRNYRRVSIPGINAFVKVERRGTLVDPDRIEVIDKALAVELERRKTSLMSQVPRSIKRAHAEKGLKFSRADFVRDILFNHPDGFRLQPRVFTKGTTKLKREEYKIPSTSTKDHLPYFFDVCPFTYELAEYVKLERLLGTNIRRFRDNYLQGDKIHPTYSLSKVVTGRSSSSDPNCFPGYVEVLTEYGWRRFDEVENNIRIAQYSAGVIDFEYPINKVEYHIDKDLVRVHKDTQIDIISTDNHRHLFVNRKNNKEYKIAARLFPKDANQVQAGRYYGGSVQLSRSKVSLICALQADGSVGKNGAIDFGFTRKRKIDRLLSQLDSENVTYTYKTYKRKENETGPTYTVHRVRIASQDVPEWLKGWKVFDSRILDFDRTTLDWFCSELWFWDGDYTKRHAWVSVDKTSADWVQIAYTLSGHRAWVKEASNSTCKNFNVVNITLGKKVSGTANRVMENIPYSGKVYCFTMPKDTLIVRYNGKVSITGNCQNFPTRGEVAKVYKTMFVAPPGCGILQGDLSQAELRIAAHMANERTLIRIYQQGGDVHAYTAAASMGLTMEQFGRLSSDDRKLNRFKAKAVNFGYLYGMWWRKFMVYAKTQYGIDYSEAEAQASREAFFSRYPNIATWHEIMRDFAMTNGYVRSLSGRVRHLPAVRSQEEFIQQEALRQAVNSPVQCFASELGVMAMSRLDQEVNEDYLAVNNFVHDALYAIVPLEYLEWGAKTLKHYMESNPLKEWFGIELSVPIVADISFSVHDAGHMHEMGKIELDKPYDFNALAEAEKVKGGFKLPKQKIPPNNGKIELPEYMHIHV